MLHTANLGCDVKALRQSFANHCYTEVLQTQARSLLPSCALLHVYTLKHHTAMS